TSPRAYVDPALAAVYGASGVPAAPALTAGPWPLAPVPVVTTANAALQAVDLDPAVRPGVLTRSGFLAAHADADSSGPIARGVFVLRTILCGPPLTRPANVPLAPPAGDPSVQSLTTRERFRQHVQDTACAGCHSVIDGIGFGFEEFDGIGAYRATENGQPIDDSGELLGFGAVDGAFMGVAELADRIAASQVLSDCFAHQAYRYAMGEVEAPGQDLGWLTAAASPDGRMTDVLLAIVRNPLFVERTFE
ncbi:MAG: DUF1588 domain-containing protein, partial [Myxococcales bacterium]|nr:DUF1588 domain-containing protein [Myxococcales bacterium]